MSEETTTTTPLAEMTIEELLIAYRRIPAKRGSELRQQYLALETLLEEARQRDAALGSLREQAVATIRRLEDEVSRLALVEVDNQRLVTQLALASAASVVVPVNELKHLLANGIDHYTIKNWPDVKEAYDKVLAWLVQQKEGGEDAS